jgi:hypothetical protein
MNNIVHSNEVNQSAFNVLRPLVSLSICLRPNVYRRLVRFRIICPSTRSPLLWMRTRPGKSLFVDSIPGNYCTVMRQNVPGDSLRRANRGRQGFGNAREQMRIPTPPK